VHGGDRGNSEPQIPAPRVEASKDGAFFKIVLNAWSGAYLIDALPIQLKFYRKLRDRKGGIYAHFYAPTVRALEDFTRRKN
jgi:hypothetical protein